MRHDEPTTSRIRIARRRGRAFDALGICAAAMLIVSGAAFGQENAPAAPPPEAPTAEQPAQAASAPALATDPALAKLIDESLAHRPELARAESAARAQSERVSQAGALPDPSIQLGIQNDGFTSIEVGKMETSFITIMATQTFPWPGKRGLRTDVADLGAQQAKATIGRVKLSTEADVRRAYLDLQLARERLELLNRLESVWKKSEGVARVRYEAGEGAQSDVLRSQLELNRVKQRRWSLQAQERASLQILNRLRGRPLDEAIETSSHVRDLGAPSLVDEKAAVEDALSRSPELAAAKLGVSQAQKSVDLARRDVYPDITVSAGVMPRGGEFPPMWTANVGTTLPIFSGRKQSKAISENELRANAEQKSVEELQEVLRLRVQERRTALSALIDSLKLYKEGLLVQSKATADSTLAQYQVGKVTFASVLEANAGYINDEDGYLQALADAQRLLIADHEVSLDPVGASAGGSMGGGSVPGAGSMSSGGASAASAPAGAAPQAASSGSMSKM